MKVVLLSTVACVLIIQGALGATYPEGPCDSSGDCDGIDTTCDSGNSKCECIATHCFIPNANKTLQECVIKLGVSKSAGDPCCADSQCGIAGINANCVNNKCSSAAGIMTSPVVLLSTLIVALFSWAKQ